MTNNIPEPQFGTAGNPWARAVMRVLVALEQAVGGADNRATNTQSSVASLSAKVADLERRINILEP
jgi:hypothetical protein